MTRKKKKQRRVFFQVRFSDSPRDNAISDSIDKAMSRGVNVSEFWKNMYWEAITSNSSITGQTITKGNAKTHAVEQEPQINDKTFSPAALRLLDMEN